MNNLFLSEKVAFFFFSLLSRKPNSNNKKAVSLFDTLGGPHVRSSFTEHICGCTSLFFFFFYSEPFVKWEQKWLLPSQVCCKSGNFESLIVAVEILCIPQTETKTSLRLNVEQKRGEIHLCLYIARNPRDLGRWRDNKVLPEAFSVWSFSCFPHIGMQLFSFPTNM